MAALFCGGRGIEAGWFKPASVTAFVACFVSGGLNGVAVATATFVGLNGVEGTGAAGAFVCRELTKEISPELLTTRPSGGVAAVFPLSYAFGI